MIDVVICGSSGRIGSKILSEIKKTKDINIIGAIELEGHPSIGKKVSENVKITSNLKSVLKKNTIIVDFTAPEGTIKHLKDAKNFREEVSFIIGTTGFSKSEMDEVKVLSKNIPCVKSHNYGIGMNILWYLIKEATKKLTNYDVEIVEFHGAEKMDSPSGTAHTIAEIITEERNLKFPESLVYGRKGLNKGGRKKDVIGIHSIRGGNYKSMHQVIYAGEGERIDLSHTEESTIVIVKGVLKSIRFIVDKEPGFYGMEKVLGL